MGMWSSPEHSGLKDSISLNRIAVLSVHTCPMAHMGGPKTGGMNVYIRDIVCAMGKLGIGVDVFTRFQEGCQPNTEHDLGYGSRIVHIPCGPSTPIPVAELVNYLDEFTEGVYGFAAKNKITYDLIHSHYWLSGIVAKQLSSRWGRLPTIHMFHTLGHMKNEVALSPAHRAPQSRLRGEKEVIENVDMLIAATPAEQEQLTRLYDAPLERIRVVPPGVALGRFQLVSQTEARQRLGLPANQKSILFVGRIEPLKGIETLLHAAWLLQSRHADVLLPFAVTIVGGKPDALILDEEMARLQDLQYRLGLCDIVHFVGAKAQSALPDYYAAADVVVMPSHYESFGMVALEAMAMGTPVVASNVGGLAHLVRHGETGFHIPAQDAESLASRLFELLMDDSYRTVLAGQARNYATYYGWDRIAEEMRHIYQEAIMAQKDRLIQNNGIAQPDVLESTP
ncbi:MAG: glycosyltransferase [Chloroflexota bacterium]